jgi:surface protein
MPTFSYDTHIKTGLVHQITFYDGVNKTNPRKYTYSHTVDNGDAVLYKDGTTDVLDSITFSNLLINDYYSVVMRGSVNYSSLFYSNDNLLEFDSGSSDVSGNLNNAFNSCGQLKKVTFQPSFDTSQVTDMSAMFAACSELTFLNLTMFDTNSVTAINDMFNGCSKLVAIAVSENFIVPGNNSNMLSGSGVNYIVVPELKVSSYNQNFGNSNLTLVGYKNSVPIDVTFSYEDNNGSTQTATFTFDVEITAQNTGPTHVDKEYTITEGSTLHVNLDSIFSDTENPYELTYTVTSDPSNVTIDPDIKIHPNVNPHSASISGHTLTFTPQTNTNYYGKFTTKVTATDLSDAFVEATITVTVTNNIEEPDFSYVQNLNQTLDWNSYTNSTSDTVSDLNLSVIKSNDGDITALEISTDGGNTYVSIYDNSSNYNLNVTVGTNYSATLRAIDSYGNQNTETITVTWNNIYNNSPPTISDKSFDINEDTELDIGVNESNFGYSDSDNQTMSYITITSLPPNGTLKYGNDFIVVNDVISTNEIIKYIPNANTTGADTFTITATDVDNGTSNAATITINVIPVNDAPVITLSTDSTHTTDNTNASTSMTKDLGITLDNSINYIFDFKTGNDNYSITDVDAGQNADNCKIKLTQLTNVSVTVNGTTYDTSGDVFDISDSAIITVLDTSYNTNGATPASAVLKYQIQDVSGDTANISTLTLTLNVSKLTQTSTTLVMTEDTSKNFTLENLVTAAGTSSKTHYISGVLTSLPAEIGSIINTNTSITITPVNNANTTDTNFVPPLSAIDKNYSTTDTIVPSIGTGATNKFTNRYIL